MATRRADELAARTRRSSIEAAIERASAIEHFGLCGDAPTVDQTIDACCSTLLDLRTDLHRLRDAANDRLHRHEAGCLLLQGEALRFDEDNLEARARESIDMLHRLCSLLEAEPSALLRS